MIEIRRTSKQRNTPSNKETKKEINFLKAKNKQTITQRNKRNKQASKPSKIQRKNPQNKETRKQTKQANNLIKKSKIE